MIEINTLLYHLNKQAIKDNLHYYFTDDVLIQEPIKFKIIEQNNDEIIVEIDNNTKVTSDMFLNKTFKYGTTIKILNVEITDKIKLQIDTNKKLPKRSYTLDTKQPILVRSSYSYSREQSGNTFNTFKRVDFSVAFKSDEQGKLYNEIFSYVELFLYKKRNTLQVYDKQNNTLIKHKYVFINNNVTSSLFVENRDNVYRTFYILIKTFNNIN